MTWRYKVAREAVIFVNHLARRIGRGSGTVIGGRVGLAISGNLLTDLTRERTVVLVSGTNGKTTTTAMITAGWGGDVATNATGSNMVQGHVAALADSLGNRAVLEVDESWLPETIVATRPSVVTLLNLSRDQLDRASEVRHLAELWREAVKNSPEVTFVANANDPLVVYATRDGARVVWCDVPTPWRLDAASCPRCAQSLRFSQTSWECECGFAKPSTVDTFTDGGLTVRGHPLSLDLALPGEFNVANAAVALTALSVLGADVPSALARLNGLTSVAGRYAIRKWGPRDLRLILAKNPAGFSAALPLIGAGELWIAINARVADGRDPSWLYDVPFEQLTGRKVICLGERRLDLATRLFYAGVDATVVDELDSLAVPGAPVTVVANYTAFEQWRQRTVEC